MWTSLQIILFCIHRNLPFGRFFEANNPNTGLVWGFFVFICIAKIPAGIPKPLLLLFTSTYTHTKRHTYIQTHTKQKQKMRTKKVTIFTQTIDKGWRSQECEIVQRMRWRGSRWLGRLPQLADVCRVIVWSKSSKKLDDTSSFCPTKVRGVC